jgi:hypothetical protein
VVEHQIKLEVRILFAVAYALEHRSTESLGGLHAQISSLRDNREH